MLPEGRSMSGSDLVEESERAGVPLKGDTDEVAQGGLDLALNGRVEAEGRDPLDVHPQVGLEQLERLERQSGNRCWRPRTALTDETTERRDPAERLGRLNPPIAFDATIHL